MSAAIAKALHDVMSEVGYVQKSGKNAFHGYKYAGEADLLEVLRPAMVKAGLLLLPSVRNVTPVDEYGNVTVIVDYMLVHKDGDIWPEKLSAAGMGNDKAKNGSVGDKGVYKAITGANKYLLFKLFQIETGDDPEQAAPHERDDTPEKAVTLPPKPSLGYNGYTEAMAKETTSDGLMATFKTLWRDASLTDGERELLKGLYDRRKLALAPNEGAGYVKPDFSNIEQDIPYADPIQEALGNTK